MSVVPHPGGTIKVNVEHKPRSITSYAGAGLGEWEVGEYLEESCGGNPMCSSTLICERKSDFCNSKQVFLFMSLGMLLIIHLLIQNKSSTYYVKKI